MKVSMYVAVSIDGFIARKDNSIDWLSDIGGETDFGYQAFYRSVDAICMGNRTYRQIVAASAWPYSDKPVCVYSRTPFAPEKPNVYATSLPPEKLAEQLRREGKQHLWVMGGGEIHTVFLNAGLVDEIRLFVMPIALGEGVPLFSQRVIERSWKLISVEVWPGDVGELRYCRL